MFFLYARGSNAEERLHTYIGTLFFSGEMERNEIQLPLFTHFMFYCSAEYMG